MKRPLIWITICLLACTLGAGTATAVPRVMLVEGFTNVGCPYCPDDNAATHEFMASGYEPAMAVGISYHVWWPDASDPFFLADLADGVDDVAGRRVYYGINSVPALFSDGAATVGGSVDALEGMASTRLTLDSPFALVVEKTVGAGQVTVDVDVTAVGTVPGNPLALRIALVETEIIFEEAPGSNGQTDFYNTMRDMLPDYAGTALVISQGQTLSFSLSAPVNAEWNLDNIRAVVWVQDETTKEVLQAGSSAALPAYAHFYGARDAAAVVARTTLHGFETFLTNYGSASDTYDIHVTPNLPLGWSGSICIGTTCYPPWIVDFVVTLAPGAQELVRVDVQPVLTVGTGTMTVTTTSRGEPADTWTRTVKLISDGLQALSVDADGGYDYETYYTAAMDATGRSYAKWDRLKDGTLTAAEMDYFDAIVWNAGLCYPPLTAGDMDELGAYLDGGGRMFISGQDIGWAMCDETSSWDTPETLAWYNAYLGADYVEDRVGDMTVSGVPGDPIGDGLAFSLDGGTGASNQAYASEIAARTGATGCFRYSPGKVAAVRYDPGTFRVVYLAYGLEGQDTESSRFAVIARSLDWLTEAVVSVPGGGPLALALEPVRNPTQGGALTVRFTLPSTAPASLELLDVAGRRVATQEVGSLGAGQYTLELGEGRVLAPGLYLVRLRQGADARVTRVTVLQ
jgi:hypothetical protein